MGNVRIAITNARALVCSAACLWGGLWLTACGSTKSGVNDETSGTSPSSDSTSNTDGAQTSTTSGAGGAASSTAASSAGGTASTSTDAGGTSSNTTGDAGGGGSAGSDTATGSGGSTETTATTMGGSANGGSAAGGTTAAGGAGGSSGSGGSGGSVATTTNGGSGGTGGTPSDCGPIPFGGPREDGPQPIDETCAQIDDEVIVERYDDADAKVPRGLYYEPPGSVSWWEDPCSESLDDTVDRIGDRAIGEIQTQVGTDWSYTVVGCSDGDHRFYNNLRCDYFDGSTLDGSTSEDLAFLASLLWWMERGNLTGAQILGYTESAGGATDTVVMCTIRTSFGDFGLCDQITLERTQYSITVAGSVTIGEPETIRTIQGDCN